MKWFKHLTDASDDEFIAALEDQFGLDGYARWWKLLEAVGAQMKKSGRPIASYPWPVWQTKLKGKRNKLETFLEHLENQRRINRKVTGNILEIEIPKLLQIKDEYSRKSGHAPDKVPPRGKSTETETETDKKEGEVLKDPPPPIKSQEIQKPKTGGNGNGNEHKSPEEMAQSYKRGEVEKFIKHAEKAHQEARGSPLVIDEERDCAIVSRLVAVKGLSADVLCRCWDEFLRIESGWIAGKPRTIKLFHGQIQDLLERTRAVEQAEARRVQSRGLVIKINPDPEAEALWVRCLDFIDRQILYETFNTWFSPTVGLVMRKDRVVIAVPNEFYMKVLSENYEREIKEALAEVGIKPAPQLEFLTHDQYELSDA